MGLSESWCLLLDVRVEEDVTHGLASVYHAMDSTTPIRLCSIFVESLVAFRIVKCPELC